MISVENIQAMNQTLAYVGIDIDEAIAHDYKEIVKMARDTMSSKIKELKTFEDFSEFVQHMEFFNLKFMGKRKKQNMYNFSHVYEDDTITSPKTDDGLNQVNYVYQEDESTGLSHVKNLYRVLDVVEM